MKAVFPYSCCQSHPRTFVNGSNLQRVETSALYTHDLTSQAQAFKHKYRHLQQIQTSYSKKYTKKYIPSQCDSQSVESCNISALHTTQRIAEYTPLFTTNQQTWRPKLQKPRKSANSTKLITWRCFSMALST
jgi:hypothetical protein